MMESPEGVFFRMGVEKGVKVGFGLGALMTLEDVEGGYGRGTLSWRGAASVVRFVDRRNGLCGFLAIQARMPIDMAVLTELKRAFRCDVYRKLGAGKKAREGPEGKR